MTFVVKPGAHVMYRRVTNNYEPCSLELKKPKLFYQQSLVADPEDLTHMLEGSFLYQCADTGFYVFEENYSYFKQSNDSLLLVVHKEYVERS